VQIARDSDPESIRGCPAVALCEKAERISRYNG
jgi:hypothetical protein